VRLRYGNRRAFFAAAVLEAVGCEVCPLELQLDPPHFPRQPQTKNNSKT